MKYKIKYKGKTGELFSVFCTCHCPIGRRFSGIAKESGYLKFLSECCKK